MESNSLNVVKRKKKRSVYRSPILLRHAIFARRCISFFTRLTWMRINSKSFSSLLLCRSSQQEMKMKKNFELEIFIIHHHFAEPHCETRHLCNLLYCIALLILLWINIRLHFFLDNYNTLLRAIQIIRDTFFWKFCHSAFSLLQK